MFLGYPLYSMYVYLRLRMDVLWSLPGIGYIPYIRGLKEDSMCSLGIPSICVSEVAEGCSVVPAGYPLYTVYPRPDGGCPL